ncbi:MAG: phosphoenolpyruvate--protein phosphotransferase [Lachnospiraceae bacterium]|nr:phosphoenolpyruvate--protein phosphotransferase [Lachnospiraceae bacterium]
MEQYNGRSVNGGIASAPIKIYRKEEVRIRREHVADTDAEIGRLELAIIELSDEFRRLADRAGENVGEDDAELFNAYIMILRDEIFIGTVKETIKNERINAEFAVMRVAQGIAEMFSAMEEEYMRSRAADMEDVADRLTRVLIGESSRPFAIDEPCILVAEDLSPAETVTLDKHLIQGIVTVKGSVTSHTAILARMMDIPAMVGVPLDLRSIKSGQMAVLDGFNGVFITNPDFETLVKTKNRMEELARESEELLSYRDLESITTDGKSISLLANVASTRDLDAVEKSGADGIGLFRSEFLYLEGRSFPDEEKQYRAYRKVLETMGDKPVVIRTMDIGADKQPDYFGVEAEENPALGFRAIRICLKKPEIFKVQLRAILRASVYGNAKILYPMVTCTWELEWIERVLKETVEELEKEGVPYKIPLQGIMIETPAAAVTADLLAEKTGFFSIGTNDLVQYTMALDRQNGMLDDFYRPKETAIKRMIEFTVKSAHENGILCGVCGELAADISMTRFFIDIGMDALSVSPGFILKLKKHIRSL